MLVEVHLFSVGACLFGIVIWADIFVILGRDFLRKMMRPEVLMEVVVELVVGKTVDIVQEDFFVFSMTWLFWKDDACERGDRGSG